MVNILMVIGLFPVVGVPLPFLSYGGSAFISSLMGLGVLLSCARDEPEARTALALDKRKAKEAPARKTSVVAARH
jgi:cell division protein FtsW